MNLQFQALGLLTSARLVAIVHWCIGPEFLGIPRKLVKRKGKTLRGEEHGSSESKSQACLFGLLSLESGLSSESFKGLPKSSRGS